MRVSRETEQKNRDVVLPEASSLWDRFWYAIVYVLAATQALILEKAIDERCWRSGDGTITRYCDLDPNHLDNIIRMIQRDGSDSPEYQALVRERQRRSVTPYQRMAGRTHRDGQSLPEIKTPPPTGDRHEEKSKSKSDSKTNR